jgi:hypothetical protein
LAVGVHFPFLDELGAQLDAPRFDLRPLARGLGAACFAVLTCSSRFLYSVGAKATLSGVLVLPEVKGFLDMCG